MVNSLENIHKNEKGHKTGFLRNNYKNLTELEAKEAYSILNIRLNMINVRDNYGDNEIDT